jgi:Putative translation initiation inhibitor, yjgF family
MSKAIIQPAGGPPALAPYSPAIKSRGTLYISGMLPLDEHGQCVAPNDVKGQTRCVMDAIAATVKAAGGTMNDVVYCMIFLKDLSDYAAMNSVYGSYFPDAPPARYCIRADLVKPEFLVEVSAIAHVAD